MSVLFLSVEGRGERENEASVTTYTKLSLIRRQKTSFPCFKIHFKRLCERNLFSSCCAIIGRTLLFHFFPLKWDGRLRQMGGLNQICQKHWFSTSIQSFVYCSPQQPAPLRGWITQSHLASPPLPPSTFPLAGDNTCHRCHAQTWCTGEMSRNMSLVEDTKKAFFFKIIWFFRDCWFQALQHQHCTIG